MCHETRFWIGKNVVLERGALPVCASVNNVIFKTLTAKQYIQDMDDACVLNTEICIRAP